MKLHPLASDALLPLSWLYDAVVRARAQRFLADPGRSKRLDAIVLSVGNITVGGTGKTPMVLWLAERLAAMDVPVGILSRGYKGSVRFDRATEAGLESKTGAATNVWNDEVAMLAHRLGLKARFGIGADRWQSGQTLTALGIKWIILDDGFQHMQLARDVDIVLVDSLDPFGGERLLPAGRLREPPEALRRADVVLITRTESAPELEARIRRYTSAPIFLAQTDLANVRPLEKSAVLSGKADWLGKRVFAFCGIGNPQGFFRDVERWGMQLAGSRAFGDHHHYIPENARRIERAALAAGAEALVCTEKDSHNLGDVSFSRLPLYCCDLRMRVTDSDAFWNTVVNVIELKGAGRA
jgi:tetraacyldisaccharide 4'-kinase